MVFLSVTSRLDIEGIIQNWISGSSWVVAAEVFCVLRPLCALGVSAVDSGGVEDNDRVQPCGRNSTKKMQLCLSLVGIIPWVLSVR